MDADIAQKQQYLFKQIIEGGYNPEEFQEYLFQKNPQAGDNLSVWSFKQLQIVVQEFIKANTPEQKEEINEEEQTVKLPQSTISEPESPSKQRSATVLTTNKHQSFSKTINCAVIKKSSIYDTPNVIKVVSWEKKQGGIFQQSYIMFKVQLFPLKTEVERRYSDFEWLRQVLTIMHPGIPMPPLPKKGTLRRYDDKYLNKRMYMLEKLLNKMNQIPDIRADETFENFFKLSPKQLEKEKSKYKKLKQIPLEKLQNLTGQINLVLDQPTNTFVSRTQKYITVVQPEVKIRIYKDFKGAATMLENCANFLNSVSKNCEDVGKKENIFRKEAELPVKPNNIFMILAQMARKYSSVLVEQAKTFRKEVYSLVKYESLSMLSLKGEFDRLATLQKEFTDKKLSLLQKKQKLYDEGNMSKWGLNEKLSSKPAKEQAFEIMLPKQTKQVLRLRNNYALINYSIYQELKRSFKQNNEYLSKFLEEIANSQSDLSSRSIMLWADVLMRIKSMKEELYM